MANKFEINIEAERFIHNDLSSCANDFQQRMQRQIEDEDLAGIYNTMMASLLFSAFSIEAKVNFVGWKKLRDGWPERSNLREKIDLLNELMSMELSWSERPLQTIRTLKKLRDVLAHGKPEIENISKVVDVAPSVREVLSSQWERDINPKFVRRCREDEEDLWHRLLEAAGIKKHETWSHGGSSLKSVVEPE